MNTYIKINESGIYDLTKTSSLTSEDLLILKRSIDRILTQNRFFRTNWRKFTSDFLNEEVSAPEKLNVPTVGENTRVLNFDFTPFVNPSIFTEVDGLTTPPTNLAFAEAIKNEFQDAWEHPNNSYNINGSSHTLTFEYQTTNPQWTPSSPPTVPQFIPLPGLRVTDVSTIKYSDAGLTDMERFIKFSYNIYIRPTLLKINRELNLNLSTP